MLVKKSFKQAKKPLWTVEMEQGGVIRRREDFIFTIFQNWLAGMYPMCMTVGSSGLWKVLSKKERVSCFGTTQREGQRIRRMEVTHLTVATVRNSKSEDTIVTHRTLTSWLPQGQQWADASYHAFHWIQTTTVVKLEFIWGYNGYALYFLITSDSVSAWLVRCQMSGCNQTIRGLHILKLYMKLFSREQYPMAAG